MTLIVEDGTGLANAESYISTADATTYFTNRGNATGWAALSNQEAALRLATDYMTQAYRNRWLGWRFTTAQALDWPRAWVPIPDSPGGYGAAGAYVATNIVPTLVAQACAELALKSASIDLSPDVSRVIKKAIVGNLSVEYDDNAPLITIYRKIDLMLKTFLISSGPSSMLTRT